MFTCAILFFWDAKPRETVSGLIGRWKVGTGWKHYLAIPMAFVVDLIYWWEPNHCVEIFRQERESRMMLYADQPIHWP